MWETTTRLVGACAVLATSLTALGQTASEHARHGDRDGHAQMLAALVYADLTCDLIETPAGEAIDYVAQQTGVRIVGRYDTDRLMHGIDAQTPITLSVQGVPALRVLERILNQCGDECTWQLRSGYLEVGTKERLSIPAAITMKAYPILALLHDVPDFDNAPELNVTAALSQWTGATGGGGGIGGTGGFGSGSSTGGGQVIGDPGEEPPRTRSARLAIEVIDVITSLIEPEQWFPLGWYQIDHLKGSLLVRAPGFVHRQIGGYPFDIRPSGVADGRERRVQFTGGDTIIELDDTAPTTADGGGER